MTQPLALVAGPASRRLGEEIAGMLRVAPTPYDDRRFPDGEIEIALGASVRGHDVFLVQATGPPVDQHLIELLLLADACHRAGASRVTAVVPYLGYARQERRTGRQALGARVVADVLSTARLHRLIVVDVHTPAIEGFFSVPIDHLSAVPLLARRVADWIGDDTVVVAPDLGAVRLAREYARLLRLPMAFVHKTRLSGDQVEAHGVVGDVGDRRPLIIDDMLSTGGTIEAAVRALERAGARLPAAVAVTHLLLAGRAREVLGGLPIARLVASDTVALGDPVEPPPDIVSVSPLLTGGIRHAPHDVALPGEPAPVRPTLEGDVP